MTTANMTTAKVSEADTEQFRLRRFVERLVQQGDCLVHDAPIDLVDVAAILDGNSKAVWFRNVGPERAELAGNIMGARRRLALALDTTEAEFAATLRQRLAKPIAPKSRVTGLRCKRSCFLVTTPTLRRSPCISSMVSTARLISPPASISPAIRRRAGPISGAAE
jgi:UbiD family decarboxylase